MCERTLNSWKIARVKSGNPYWRGWLSTVELVVLTCLDRVFLYCRFYLSFFTKQTSLIWWSMVLSLPLQSVFPGEINKNNWHRVTMKCSYSTYLLQLPSLLNLAKCNKLFSVIFTLKIISWSAFSRKELTAESTVCVQGRCFPMWNSSWWTTITVSSISPLRERLPTTNTLAFLLRGYQKCFGLWATVYVL
jgi:hypothetical protein